MLSLRNTWLFQEDAIALPSLDGRALMFIEYVERGVAVPALLELHVFSIETTTFDHLTADFPVDGGEFTNIVESLGVAIAGLGTILKSVPIFSQVTEISPASWSDVKALIEGE